MKKILSIFIILYALFVISHSDALVFESEYQSYFGNVSFLNNYQYYHAFHNQWSFRHYGTLSQSRNRRFHRYSRNADLVWQISKDHAPFYYSFHFDYNAAIDKAKPDLEQYEIEKTWRKAGVDLFYNPVDSLTIFSGLTYIRADEVNSRYSDETLYSNGYQNNNNIRYARDYQSVYLSLDTFFNILHLDYDFSRSYGADLIFDFLRPLIDTELSFQRNRNKIYLLNDEIDTHIRSVYKAAGQYRTRITDNIDLRLGNTFQVRDNRLKERRDRNYLEIDNSLIMNTDYNWRRFRVFVGGEYRIFNRSFKEELSSRDQEHRIFNSGASYFFSERDSLVFTRNLSLIRTDYTVSTSILDNDQLIDEKQISLYTYFRDNIRLINHFNYTQREDVYVKSGMSANNKVTRIYNLLPSLHIALNNNMLFLQEYHLRADYDDFSWEETVRDRMYRKFSASYTTLTGFPWVTGFYNNLPDREYFYQYNDLVLGLTYIYDTNSSGNRVGNAYEVFVENEYHTLQIELFRRIERIEFRVRPRFIWTDIQYEFNHLFEFTYLLPNRQNYATIGVNSTGKSLEDLLWRINALVYIAF